MDVVPLWLILGDSIVLGMAPRLHALLPSGSQVEGIQGSGYARWAGGRMVEAATAALRPAVVVIALGTNPGGETDLDKFAGDARAAVAQARGRGAEVLLVGPFASDDDGQRLAALRTIAPDAVDGYELARGLPRTSDGIHFLADGYAKLADRMVYTIRKTLEGRVRNSNGYFLPGWAWGIVAAVAVGAVGLMALGGKGESRPRVKGWKDYQPPRPSYRHGYERSRFWPSVDKARTLAVEAGERFAEGDREGARAALREARTALKVASYYATGPHTEQILRARYGLVSELEEAVAA